MLQIFLIYQHVSYCACIFIPSNLFIAPLQWLHNVCDGISNHQTFASLPFVQGIHRWPVIAMDLTDDESALVQVMAWCRQAPVCVDQDLCHHMASLGHNESNINFTRRDLYCHCVAGNTPGNRTLKYWRLENGRYWVKRPKTRISWRPQNKHSLSQCTCWTCNHFTPQWYLSIFLKLNLRGLNADTTFLEESAWKFIVIHLI